MPENGPAPVLNPNPPETPRVLDDMPMTTAREAPPSIGKRIRRLLYGRPLSSEHMEHTLLSKLVALPVFSSDAISSVAYATQQIVLALGAAGLYAAEYQHEVYEIHDADYRVNCKPCLIIVVLSYWQTIFGYPSGGGSYIVSKDNLGVACRTRCRSRAAD